MNQKVRIRIGFFIATIILAGGYLFLYKAKQYAHTHRYFGYYEHVQGLSEGAPVQLRGVRIGKVDDIQLNGRGRVKVTLVLPRQYRLRSDDLALLIPGSLTGGKIIEIVPGGATDWLPDLATVRTAIDTNLIDDFSATITPAIEQSKFLLRAADSGLNVLKYMVSGGLTPMVINGLIRLDTQTRAVAAMAAGLNESTVSLSGNIRSLNQSFGTLSQKNASRDSSLKGAAAQSSELAATPLRENIRALGSSLSRLGQTARELKTSSWVTDSSDITALSQELDSLSNSLSSTQEDPPGISIFGKKKKKG
jgi:ABC-type transporter Mla subunit MlaD